MGSAKNTSVWTVDIPKPHGWSSLPFNGHVGDIHFQTPMVQVSQFLLSHTIYKASDNFCRVKWKKISFYILRILLISPSLLFVLSNLRIMSDSTICIQVDHILIFITVSLLVVYLPLWKIWVRQLGCWHSQYIWKVIIHSCSKPPTSYR